MLELYFKYPRVLRRLRSGALGGEMDRIAAHFAETGYMRASAKIYIAQIGRFSAFAARNAQLPAIDQTTIDRFLHSLRTVAARIAARTVNQHAKLRRPMPWPIFQAGTR